MKNVLKNVRQKLANARELCPGMSSDMFLLTDYMSKNTNDTIVPTGVMVMVDCVMDDIEKGTNGAGVELPDEFKTRRELIINEILWFPQVIDAIADEAFAKEVRTQWKKFFGMVPPKRVNTREIKLSSSHPEYINAAVDWWANAIISPKFDSGVVIPVSLLFLIVTSTKEYTPDEIKIFKETLAGEIEERMKKDGYCCLSVDYHPCDMLMLVGQKIGVDDTIGYPCQTYMKISQNEVSVVAGYSAPKEILWSKVSA